MSKRLQVIMADEELEQLRRCASHQGLTLSEWARRALRRARQNHIGPAPAQKVAALERALRLGHPTGDIEEILASIEEGRGLR
ncbi:MAG: antitoxin [Acidobacteriota bacterium]